MALLDNLFSKKPSGKAAASQSQDAGPTNPSAEDGQAMERKSQRLERRELLYAVVRESMARVGMLVASYKYKVLSLDSKGSQFLIMMDLPKEMAEHIGQLAEIEEVVTQTAQTRHKIEVTAVYWRINELSKSSVLRKPRVESETSQPRPIVRPEAGAAAGASITGGPGRRYEPIRSDEVNAFKQALAAGTKPKTPAATPSRPGFAPTEFSPTEFEATKLMDEEPDRNPLGRTQYGDLI